MVDSKGDTHTASGARAGFSLSHWYSAAPSWLTSMLFHIVLLLLLAMATFGVNDPDLRHRISVIPLDPQEELKEFKFEKIDDPPVKNATTSPVDPLTRPLTPENREPPPTPLPDPLANNSLEVDSLLLDPTNIAPDDWLISITDGTPDGDLTRRTPGGRKRTLEDLTHGEEIDEATTRALRWLAAHQHPNGYWSFDHTDGYCRGRCPNPGKLKESHRAATAMALMAFLGHGDTHLVGSYRTQIKAGLSYLVGSMHVKDNGTRATLEEPGGQLYAHGLGSIVLCEAYAMTKDRNLLAPAQLSLNHIAYAQDPVGGGWRYTPKQAGDMSVAGWMFMAVKSGEFSHLQLGDEVLHGANRFLDSTQTDSGARYGYTGPTAGDATTAIGLLCRMYSGWQRDHPALARGVAFLDKKGPSKGNLYYNYYATQVMHHYEGEPWQRWDERMRPLLLKTQATGGHVDGSWYFAGGDLGADRGGRLYCTAMATMILEVYYRHQPLYQNQAIDEEFAL